jgi:alpha-L-fucosidase 2
MVFGGVGHERIALNEESVWSGSRINWNRENAAENLPKIRELLLAGKNAEAEAMVNQTFTCVRGGSRGGARGPWGCYQELGNLNIVWGTDVKSLPLTQWKYRMITTPGITDIREHRSDVQRQMVADAAPDADDSDWDDYVIADGKAVKGDRRFNLNDKAILRHEIELTAEQVASYGMLRVGVRARNGHVFVNGQQVGDFPGWQSIGHASFEADVSEDLKVGRNVIAIYCSNYRRRGQLPVAISLEASEKTESYRRSLDLSDAISRVAYKKGGITFTREAFSSAPDQVMVFRFTADRPGSISFDASLNRLMSFETCADGPDGLLMTGNTASGQSDVEGLEYVARLRAVHSGGKASVIDDVLRVSGADEVVLLVAAATDYQGFAGRRTAEPLQATREDIAKASAKSYQELLSAHIADYQSYFNRMSITLGDGEEENRKAAALPTNQRLAALAKGGVDPALAALYFSFGRYLLISSSRPGTMPANLQGIWAEGIQTPWNCDFHLDINVQMNYWSAEMTGLGDCHTPLFKLIESLQKPGAETAKTYYNAKGWVAHVITNPWGFTAPGEQAGWGATATGSPWLCDHLWEHYDFNRDGRFLEWAYPIMKGSAEFFLDMLITDPKTGWLVTAPSNSPENTFKYGDGKSARICMGPTMDMQILRELFSNCIKASEVLGVDGTFRARLVETRKALAPNQVGKHGQIQEWLEDYEEAEQHHRHVSQLYGLHPYDEVTLDETPKFAEAAKISLQRRGDGGTGWSMAWKVNFWARLHDGNHALLMLNNLIKKGGANLFCQHPPFQIDGNFGGTSGVGEMLLQSRGRGDLYMIDLLPALPDAWPDGKVSGLRARGGYRVDMAWQGGKLVKATIHNLVAEGKCSVRYGTKTVTLSIPKGGSESPSFRAE